MPYRTICELCKRGGRGGIYRTITIRGGYSIGEHGEEIPHPFTIRVWICQKCKGTPAFKEWAAKHDLKEKGGSEGETMKKESRSCLTCKYRGAATSSMCAGCDSFGTKVHRNWEAEEEVKR